MFGAPLGLTLRFPGLGVSLEGSRCRQGRLGRGSRVEGPPSRSAESAQEPYKRLPLSAQFGTKFRIPEDPRSRLRAARPPNRRPTSRSWHPRALQTRRRAGRARPLEPPRRSPAGKRKCRRRTCCSRATAPWTRRREGTRRWTCAARCPRRDRRRSPCAGAGPSGEAARDGVSDWVSQGGVPPCRICRRRPDIGPNWSSGRPSMGVFGGLRAIYLRLGSAKLALAASKSGPNLREFGRTLAKSSRVWLESLAICPKTAELGQNSELTDFARHSAEPSRRHAAMDVCSRLDAAESRKTSLCPVPEICPTRWVTHCSATRPSRVSSSRLAKIGLNPGPNAAQTEANQVDTAQTLPNRTWLTVPIFGTC